jgi:beta-lactamase class A
MCDWLQRDLNPHIWKKQPPNPIEFNPVESFFGEALPSDAQLASKAGWTSGTRAEAAFVTAKDAQAAYILVIFADDPAYAADKKIFPEMSRLVYKRMSDRHK